MSIKGFKVGTAASEQYDYNYLDNKPDLSVYATKTEVAAVDDVALAAYPSDTATGAIASFSDGADGIPMKSVVCDINPSQDLHGYDNPWPAGGGKNKLPYPYAMTSQEINGVTFTVNSDGSIKANGTASANADLYCVGGSGVYSDAGIATGDYLVTCEGVTSASITGTLSFYVNDGNSFVEVNKWNTSKSVSMDSEKTYRIFFRVYSGATVNNVTFYPMIRLSTVADATWQPYSNICPISGFTGLTLTRTGKNLFNKDADGKQVGWAIDPNTFSPYQTGSGNYNLSDYVPIKGGQSYIASGTTHSCDVVFYDKDKTAIVGYSSFDPRTAPSNAEYLRFDYWKADEDTIMLNLGSTAETYTPYQGNAYPISWQSSAGTVYGGTLDVVSGLLTVDSALWTASAGNLARSGDNTFYSTAISNIKHSQTQNMTDVISNKFKAGVENNQDTCFINISGRIRLNTSTGYSTVEDMIADIGEITVVYPLATPQTYQLTPTEVDSLLGANNLWHDANGNTTAVYRADTALYIDKKIAAVQALILEN